MLKITFKEKGKELGSYYTTEERYNKEKEEMRILSYQDDLRYFYNMTQEQADRYWKELKYNESLIVRKEYGI